MRIVSTLYVVIVGALFAYRFGGTVAFWCILAMIAGMMITYHEGYNDATDMEATATRSSEELG